MGPGGCWSPTPTPRVAVLLLLVAPSLKVLLGMLRVQWTPPPFNLEFSGHLWKYHIPWMLCWGRIGGSAQYQFASVGLTFLRSNKCPPEHCLLLFRVCFCGPYTAGLALLEKLMKTTDLRFFLYAHAHAHAGAQMHICHEHRVYTHAHTITCGCQGHSPSPFPLPWAFPTISRESHGPVVPDVTCPSA